MMNGAVIPDYNNAPDVVPRNLPKRDLIHTVRRAFRASRGSTENPDADSMLPARYSDFMKPHVAPNIGYWFTNPDWGFMYQELSGRVGRFARPRPGGLREEDYDTDTPRFGPMETSIRRRLGRAPIDEEP